MICDRQSSSAPLRARCGRYADTPGTFISGLEPRPAPYIIESIAFSFSCVLPLAEPGTNCAVRKHEPAFLNGTV
jgi:hypothetical protein